MSTIVTNLVTPKVGAKHELLFNKLVSDECVWDLLTTFETVCFYFILFYLVPNMLSVNCSSKKVFNILHRRMIRGYL